MRLLEHIPPHVLIPKADRLSVQGCETCCCLIGIVVSELWDRSTVDPIDNADSDRVKMG
jgi:hypothetical protein